MNILIVEDDPTLMQNICDALTAEGFLTAVAYDGMIAARILRKDAFDCVIMDVNLPGLNGYDLCGEYRTFNQDTPVLFLTAFGDLEDKVKGYEVGADDYLTKPFFMRELVMRVQSLVRRSKSMPQGQGKSQQLVADDIVINQATKTVYRQGVEIPLTPREYQILLKLMENQGEIISKTELIKEIWGSAFETNTNTIEVYVNFLRNKLDKPFGKNAIKTKVGFGYYLDFT